VARAFCPKCGNYPTELWSWPIIDEEVPEDGDIQPIRTETAVVLENDGTPTNRWADGVSGVLEAVQERADADESPVCGECKTYIIWVHDGPKHFEVRRVEQIVRSFPPGVIPATEPYYSIGYVIGKGVWCGIDRTPDRQLADRIAETLNQKAGQ
jgi:hypothetical protein